MYFFMLYIVTRIVYLIINAYRNAFNNTIRVQSFTALRNVVQNTKSYFFEIIQEGGEDILSASLTMGLSNFI